MAEYQVQLQDVTADGNKIPMMPINRSLDVKVGKLSAGSLVLPGSSDDEILAQTLANVKKYLSNLANIAAKTYGVTSSTTNASESNLATAKAVNDLKVRIDGNDTTLATHATNIAAKAPTNHAATALTYGGATGSKYGHVKLSDAYASAVENGDAANSIGASQNALFNAYNTLNAGKAPNNHAVNNSTYGLGTGSVYGHVKLSDTYASKVSSGAAANGLGASQNALYNAYDTLKDLIDTNTTNIGKKAPTNHASTATTYGVGTASNYGHVKLSDAYSSDNSATGAAANSIAASSWAVYRAYSSLSTVISGKLASSHADEKATASKFSHVKLSDTYASAVSSGGAAGGIGASQNALYNAYAALLSSITSLQSTVTTLNSNMYSKLATTAHNPTSETTYSIPFCTPSDTGGMYRYNNGIRYTTLEGTASALGRAMIQLGNSVTEGVAGNKQGELRIYGKSASYVSIKASDSLATNRNITLPITSGTLAVVSLDGTTLTINT